MKFVREVSEYGFFIKWTNKEFGVRIIRDAANKSFFKYEVQKFNGKTWDKVRSFITLKEAKVFCEEII